MAEQDSFGPLEPILADPEVTDIMVNGPSKIFYVKQGKLLQADAQFKDDDQVMGVIELILKPLGRAINESHPIIDARLEDGSLVHVIIPPISLNGPILTIRKTQVRQLSIEDLKSFGTATQEMFDFLEACVKSRLTVVVSGGTGSGKTTILNRLTDFIDDDERIVSIEYASELHIEHNHVVRLEARPPNIEGKGEVSIAELVIQAARIRPERIILSEVNSSEVMHLVQLINTGHDGALFGIHANSPRDALSRMEVMCTMAGLQIPILNIRQDLASAVDIIVQQQRLRDGSRKILNITEVTGMQNNLIAMQDIFEFQQTDFKDGKIIGAAKPTGVIPKCRGLLEDNGFDFPDSFFTP